MPSLAFNFFKIDYLLLYIPHAFANAMTSIYCHRSLVNVFHVLNLVEIKVNQGGAILFNWQRLDWGNTFRENKVKTRLWASIVFEKGLLKKMPTA